MNQLINHDVTTAFATIAIDPFLDFNKQSQIFGLRQRFTVVLYSKGSTLEHVDELKEDRACTCLVRTVDVVIILY